MLRNPTNNFQINMYKRGMFENVAVPQIVTIGGKNVGATYTAVHPKHIPPRPD